MAKKRKPSVRVSASLASDFGYHRIFDDDNSAHVRTIVTQQGMRITVRAVQKCHRNNVVVKYGKDKTENVNFSTFKFLMVAPVLADAIKATTARDSNPDQRVEAIA